MSISASPCSRLSTLELAAQIEGCCTAFFSTSANMELLPDTDSRIEQYLQQLDMIAIVSLGGMEKGYVAVACPEKLANSLASGILGDKEQPTPYLTGSILGDTAHILAESLLDLTVNRTCYQLSPPSVFKHDRKLLASLIGDQRGYCCSFTHQKLRLLVKVVLFPEDCLAASLSDFSNKPLTPQQAQRLFYCPRYDQVCKREHHH